MISRRNLLLWAVPAIPLTAQFSTGVRVVNVFVTVRDRQGNLVRNLTQQDFSIAEDGRRQDIRYFSADSAAPLSVGLLFDLSGSQRAVIQEQRATGAAFLRQMLRRDADQAFLLGFNQRTHLLEPLTADRTRLDDSLRRMDVPRAADGQLLPEAQGTALFDALSAGAQILDSVSGRKAIVVISDGIDTASTTRQNIATQNLQRADVLLYPIRVYDRKVFAFEVPGSGTDRLREGKKSLERMARETGGGFFDVSDTQTLSAAFARLAEELGSQYSLGYTPPSTGGSYRKIRVTVKPKGLTVQAREGYYPGT